MNKVLYSLTWKGEEKPTIDALLRTYQIKEAEIDQDFGIIEIDPENKLYAIMVEAEVAGRLSNYEGDLKGPYANVRIEPMGLEGAQQEE